MNRLDKYFKEYNKIDEEVFYDMFYMEAEELINPRRIDIIVKYYYIKCRETGEGLDFAKELYEKHIEAFSDGTFKEAGNPEKTSIEDYIEVFDKLIDDFKENGFDEDVSIIPIGRNKEILDGSHRTACALYFKIPVKVVKFPDLSLDYGFEFFRKRLLDRKYLDFIAKEYASLKENIYAFLVWPRLGNDQNIEYIEEELNEGNCRIIYSRKFKMDRSTLWDLVFNIYKEEHWVGYNKEKFKGVNHKTDQCYDEDGYLKVYALECSSLKELVNQKESLREHFALGKSSFHSTDTHQETVEILNFLLDEKYDEALHGNFLRLKDSEYTWIRFIRRKLRYMYRLTINKIKSLLGKPV